MAGAKAYDRIWDTSTTTGTGSVTLTGTAPTGYRSFASTLANGDICDVCIALGADWEVSRCTFTSPNLLARSTVLASSNAGAKTNFGAGTKDVILVQSAAGTLLANIPTTGNPANNGDLSIVASSNSNLVFKYKGSDGVVRTVNMPLS